MTRYKDDYRDHCGECIHFAPWPERLERVREVWGTVPMGYPTGACMACATNTLAVSPDDCPAKTTSVAAGCTRFERGKRAAYIREVGNAD